MDRFIGKLLDNRYEILEVIGVGGMAVVYKAKCHRLNRYVAVKILKDEYAADDELRRQFHEESQAVAMLSHPNIVAVYDVSKTEELEYIVMELIDGITLKEYLSRRGPLSPKEVTVFATQIAKALEHAHSRDIIHRDIKPQNIMLLRDGTLKVADFGIAHIASRQTDRSKGEAIGSVHYVSPEQARGSNIDNRSDLYSLGVVMYEMLTGRLPFEGETPVAVALQHINSIPLLPSELVDGIPDALEQITMKAMSPNLSKRYASATEILEDLEDFRNDSNFKIEIPESNVPVVMGDENSLDATRKLQNPAQAVHAMMEEKNGKTEGKPGGKKTVSSTLVFSLIAVFLFFAGALYFVIFVINPFGGKEDEKLTAPGLVGKIYDEVIQDSTYKAFKIEEGEWVYDDKTEAGIILSQTPTKGRNVGTDKVITVTISRGPKTIELDDYSKLDARQVKILLDRSGILHTEQYEFNEDVEKDCVIRTDPAAGTSVTAGDTVVLYISQGKDLKDTKVPVLIGMSQGDAIDAIVNAGLTVGTVTPVESTKPAGQVVFQELPGGSIVKEETVVNFQISKGPKQVKMPKLEGNTQAVATSLLEAAGFQSGQVKQVYSDQPVGTVVKQYTEAGTLVDEGIAVNFDVSMGADPNAGNSGSDAD